MMGAVKCFFQWKSTSNKVTLEFSGLGLVVTNYRSV